MAKHKNITTDSLEDKISKLSNILHDIKALGVNITITQRQEVRLVVKEASEELEDMKDCLLDTVMDQLSPRQVGVLIGDTSTSHDDTDDSFCLEWEAVFGRCFNIVNNLRIYLQKLSVGLVDSLTLAIILTDCNLLQSEVEHHARLLLSNKLQPPSSSETRAVRAVKYRKNKSDSLAWKTEPRERKQSLIKHLSASVLKFKI